MKPILVFAGCDFYPSGGMKDFIGDVDTLEEAKQLVNSKKDSWQTWANAVDTRTNKTFDATDLGMK